MTSQIARSKTGRGGRRTLSYAFTEHGTIMTRAKKKQSLKTSNRTNLGFEEKLRQAADIAMQNLTLFFQDLRGLRVRQRP